MERPSVSIIFPIHNGLSKIQFAYESIKRVMQNIDYEIIFAEDGSSDGSDTLLRNLSQSDERVKLLHADERLGRGRAVRKSIHEARGDTVVYMDIDLSTNLGSLRAALKNASNYDIIIGSRLLSSSKTVRSPIRDFMSRSYNFLICLIFSSKIHDHQCGFKIFRKKSIIPILDVVRSERWFWDTELLLIAQSNGLSILEMPVDWVENPDSTVNVFSDSAEMAVEIARFYKSYWIGRRK